MSTHCNLWRKYKERFSSRTQCLGRLQASPVASLWLSSLWPDSWWLLGKASLHQSVIPTSLRHRTTGNVTVENDYLRSHIPCIIFAMQGMRVTKTYNIWLDGVSAFLQWLYSHPFHRERTSPVQGLIVVFLIDVSWQAEVSHFHDVCATHPVKNTKLIVTSTINSTETLLRSSNIILLSL